MSNKIKVNCAACNQAIDYDGKINFCPLCLVEFERENIVVWKKQLSAQIQLQSEQPESSTLSSDKATAPPKMPSGAIRPRGAIVPGSASFTPVSGQYTSPSKPQERKPASNGAVCEVCGKRYYAGQEKNAFLFILQRGLIDEIVDCNNLLTDKAKRLLSSMGVSEPVMKGYSRIRKFFELLYGTVFSGMELPFYINDESTGEAVASDRSQFISRLESNAYSNVVFTLNDERMTLCELVESSVAGAYLRVGEGIGGLRQLFKFNGKRVSIDENCVCTELGNDADICRIDDKIFKRYKYYLDGEFSPCDGYEEVPFDISFLSAYKGYAYGKDVEEFMKEYFFLLSTAFKRNGSCEVFGVIYYSANDFLSALKASAEAAAEKNERDRFILMRELLRHKVFGRYTSGYEMLIAQAPNVESALFEAYYGLSKEKKLLRYDGRYLTAQSIAQRVGERGSLGNMLNDVSGESFLASVKRCVDVDVSRINRLIDEGIKNILEGLK